MADQPRTNINDVRIREMAALACAPAIIHSLLDVNIIRVMGSFGTKSTFTQRYILGCLSASRMEVEPEYVSKHIDRLLDMNVIWQPDDRYQYYKLTDDMVQLIRDIQNP